MRDKSVYHHVRALPRMSWSPHNLYNLWLRTFGRLAEAGTFTSTRDGLFKQRWQAKRMIRGYHGDFVGETKFKRWYLPPSLPDVRARRRHGSEAPLNDNETAKLVGRTKDVAKDEERRAKQEAERGNTPVGSLFLSELERRLDVVIFRSCMAPSVYHARHIIIRGAVKLNGKEHTNANTRMNPGDMVSVDPLRIPFLRTDALKDEFTYGSITTIAQPAEQEPVSSTTEEPKPAADEGEQNEPSSTSTEEVETAKERKPLAHGTKPFLTTPSSIVASNGSVFHLPPYASPFLFIPAYLEVNFPTCSTVYVRHPTARSGYSEVPTPYDADGELIRLAWEWYSRIRPRMRRKRDIWMSPNQTYGQWPML